MSRMRVSNLLILVGPVLLPCISRQTLAFQTNWNHLPSIRREKKFSSNNFFFRNDCHYSTVIQKHRDDKTKRYIREWDGDDLRWMQRIRRRIYRKSDAVGGSTPVRTSLITINFLFFVYQTVNTVRFIIMRHPDWWPSDAMFIISDTLLGYTNVKGSLTTDFVHSSYLSKFQPHRFLTSGFLHGDIIHLLCNLDALRRLPSWLETGLGAHLYLTTFLLSIVTGNIGHNMIVVNKLDRVFCLGASGGICGLYGLMWVALIKMGRSQSAWQVIKGMLVLFLYGLAFNSVSNAAHVGGFVGGVVMGMLCAPNYRKSYTQRRKWSLEVDPWPRDYRTVMGFGIAPSQHGYLRVSYIWVAVALAIAMEPKFRAIPISILRGMLRPGSLSFASQ